MFPHILEQDILKTARSWLDFTLLKTQILVYVKKVLISL